MEKHDTCKRKGKPLSFSLQEGESFRKDILLEENVFAENLQEFVFALNNLCERAAHTLKHLKLHRAASEVEATE